MSGERGRNRTFNLVIKSHLLCQLSYAPLPDYDRSSAGFHSGYNGIILAPFVAAAVGINRLGP